VLLVQVVDASRAGRPVPVPVGTGAGVSGNRFGARAPRRQPRTDRRAQIDLFRAPEAAGIRLERDGLTPPRRESLLALRGRRLELLLRRRYAGQARFPG